MIFFRSQKPTDASVTLPAPLSLLLLFLMCLSVMTLSQGCSENKDALHGSNMSRIELAREFNKLLGADGKSVVLNSRTTRQLQLGKDRCPERGLFLSKGAVITGPHFIIETLLAEFAPKQEMNFAWCQALGSIPNIGSVYFEEFMYEKNKCGKETALKELRKLKSATGKTTVYIKNLCHTLISKIGQLGLYVEVGAESVTHKDLPGAPPFNLLYLKSIELHVLPAEDLAKQSKQQKGKIKIDKSLRAAMVLSKPEKKFRSVQNVLHGSSSSATVAAACNGKPVPLKFKPIFNFNYFNSAIVKKAKSSGSASIFLALYKKSAEKREPTGELVKALLKPDQIIGFKPSEMTLLEAGDYELEVKLDTEVVVTRKFSAHFGKPTGPAAGNATRSCTLELDTALSGITKDSITLNL